LTCPGGVVWIAMLVVVVAAAVVVVAILFGPAAVAALVVSTGGNGRVVEISFRGRAGGRDVLSAALFVVTTPPASTARSFKEGRAGAASEKRAGVDPVGSPA
jgi:hypothetical protein